MAKSLNPENFYTARNVDGIGSPNLSIGADLSMRMTNSRNDGLMIYRFIVGVLGVSTGRIADHLDISPSAMSKYHTEKAALPLKHRIAMCELLQDLSFRLNRLSTMYLETIHQNGHVEIPPGLRAHERGNMLAQMKSEGAEEADMRRAYIKVFEGYIEAADALLKIEQRAFDEIFAAGVLNDE